VTSPMPQPRPGAPWPSPLPPPAVACCELAAGGDWCDCDEMAREMEAAFASPLRWGWTR
jgi:hypothetical protein